MSDVATKVQAIIVDKLGVDASEVTNEASFTNDLGADSLDTVELIMEFEKEFDIQIPDDKAESIATVGDAKHFKNARQLAAWLGLVPRQHSTGGKTVLLGISKRGDGYLRKLLVHGARAVVSHSKKAKSGSSEWLTSLLETKHTNTV